jgi:hypothetical protein
MNPDRSSPAGQHRAGPPRNWIGLSLWVLLVGTIVFVPGYPLGFLDGVPADHVVDFASGIVLAGLILSRDFARVSVRKLLVLTGLILVAAGLRWGGASAYGKHGLLARYESENPAGRFQCEKSTTWNLPGASRIDPSIDFEGTAIGFGRRPLWTDFLNTLRTPCGTKDERLAARLRVHWSGSVRPDRDCRLAVAASCPSDLCVGDTGMLQAGKAYPLRLEARFPDVRAPRLRLVTADDRQTVPASWLFPAEPRWSSPLLAGILASMSWAVLAIVVPLLVWVSDPRGLEVWGKCFLLLACLGSGFGLWEYHLLRDPAYSLMPPDDYLLYETEARRLVLNGFLQDDGIPFHRSAGMRYYLSAAHALFGESGYGVILFQQVLRGVTALLALSLVRRLSRRTWPGWVAAVVIAALPSLVNLSLRYWSETVGEVLFMLVCLALVHGDKGRTRHTVRGSIGTGFGVGLLGLLRTNALSLVPALFLWMVVRRGWRPALAYLAIAVGVLGLVPVRNAIVTGEGVLTPTQGAINLIAGNNLPRDTDLAFARTGVPEDDLLLRQGMEHLWEFDDNPAANFDVFPPRDNARMQGPLLRVWLAYVVQHPGHFLGQVLVKTRDWFFPGWLHAVSVFSLFAAVGLGAALRQGNRSPLWVLLYATGAYSSPFLIAYGEPRHRAVMLPALVVLAVVGGVSLLPDRARALARKRTPPAGSADGVAAGVILSSGGRHRHRHSRLDRHPRARHRLRFWVGLR